MADELKTVGTSIGFSGGAFLQDLKSGGIPNITANVAKVKLEAERLEVMDKAAGILAELLYTKNMLAEVKEYRPIMIHVRKWLVYAHNPLFGGGGGGGA